ncbi:MAG: glycoside hydrolase family 2 [Candidatus Poribacteria bacterium]|nr:glycoside hydrolase family 2 [Candidatus Poribacteria bacterium]
MKKKFRLTALNLVAACVILSGASCAANLEDVNAAWPINRYQDRKSDDVSKDRGDSKPSKKLEQIAGNYDTTLGAGETHQDAAVNESMSSTVMTSEKNLQPTRIVSLDGEWLLAIDPDNIGREQGWHVGPISESKRTKVPWIVQEAFPGYFGGVAWYWRDFHVPANPHKGGRYLLRFWTVSYKSDIWVNGVSVGEHEGGEDMFFLDVTEAVTPTETNQIAVRVLNPTEEPIDGIVRSEIPQMGLESGILDSVELVIAPAVRIEDLYVIPDYGTGDVRIQANLRYTKNLKDHPTQMGDQEITETRDSNKPKKVTLEFTVAPANSGETLDAVRTNHDLPPGDTLINVTLNVKNYRLWELNSPNLYRVTARARLQDSNSFDELSTRCGFRDFRFEKGYFRLNDRRILVRGALAMPVTPISGRVPYDPHLLRLDLLQLKVMGFNTVRFFSGVPRRFQLDLADEIGIMVYEESFASWEWGDSPKMPERFDNSIIGMIKRDRNHPSVVMWGLMNENFGGEMLRYAVNSLRLVRSHDNSRVVILNSGRSDHQAGLGSISNPGSTVWEDVLDEGHPYRGVPHGADVIKFLRTVGKRAYFMSEFGNGTAQNLAVLTRQYELHSAEFAIGNYRHQLDGFMADWNSWNMGDTFASPEDYFRRSMAKLAGQRLVGFNAIRANPNVVGYLLSGMNDFGRGTGLNTVFRELKPGTVDALSDINAPLRWCLFVEPVNIYRNSTVRLEAVLANEDVLQPGKYPVRVQVIDSNQTRVFERTVTVTVPPRDDVSEPSFVIPVLSEDVVIGTPEGKYRFMAVFEKGAAAAGGEVEFHVADPAKMPPVETEVVLWGEDAELAKWLSDHDIRTRAFDPDATNGRELILVSHKPHAQGGRETFQELARRLGRGSTAVFLSPDVFHKPADWYQRPDQPLGWLPLKNKGALSKIANAPAVFPKDEWAKNHPIFEGLPSGGLMDHLFYREIVPDIGFTGQDVPAEVVAGAINTGQGSYASGLLLSVNDLGAGRFILNTLRIRENLGNDPVAERLLRNMLRYAARDISEPLVNLPADFDAQLAEMGL